MSELHAIWWHGYGRPKVIVKRADGSRVGFWDLVTDDARPDCPEDLEPLVERVRQWKAEHPDKVRRVRAAPKHGSTTRRGEVTDDEPQYASGGHWTDLAGNPAGAEARKRAHEKRSDSRAGALWQRIRGTNKDERNWRIGADGEAKVGSILQRVAHRNPRWRLPINAVPVGERGTDIDHVVIGSGGVFTVNVKHHPRREITADRDTVRVDGRNRHYVEKSRHEAGRVSDLLSTACGFTVHVEALLVIVGARTVSVGRPIDGVHVLEAGSLPRWMQLRCDIHSEGTVQTMYDAARRSTVWRPPQL